MSLNFEAAPKGAPQDVSPPWLEMLLLVARHYNLNFSPEDARLTAAWQNSAHGDDQLYAIAKHLGLSVKVDDELQDGDLTQWRMPLLVQLLDGQLALIQGVRVEGQLQVKLSGDHGLPTLLSREELVQKCRRVILLRPTGNRADVRVDAYIKPYDKNWFKDVILLDLKSYRYVMFASLLVNLLGLAGILFSMQTYDRVVPAGSMPTLYVLFIGVLIAAGFDFMMRNARSHLTDLLGKRADTRLSDKVFGHAIRLRNSARPRSTGTFISQVRELEQIRELITSSTITALADLPFFLLFLAVFWMLVGPLGLIPLFALVLMIGPGLLCQGKLGRLANEALRESSLRNALLVETIQGLDDVKALQAEQKFQLSWNHYNSTTASANLRLKALTHRLQYWSQSVQTLVFALVIFFGAPMVMAGELTTGALVAASILGSRMMAPMAMLTQVIIRWQQAKTALDGLDKLMQLPTDHPEHAHKVHRQHLYGDYELSQAKFAYGEDSPVLQVETLSVRAGERIAVLGRNGAGKSTLLQALVGGVDVRSGAVSLDGVRLNHLDPADLRRDVALLTQDARLFHGTIRENLQLGAPLAADQEMLTALALTGANVFVEKLPTGLDHLIMEGGLGLSGGQKQALLLARLLLRQPNVLLLDEPTSSLDEGTEQLFLEHLDAWAQGKTLLIATHRPALLALVNRIIVVDEGRIVLDEPKDRAISLLSRARTDSTPGADSNA
ncbi:MULTISPECIES: type I secretion system permease/ATPase [Pseudomonas]|uniref:Type I secretion system permease/ATPase n=1 Tax=Pseudomonas lactis TaxID=1615674 RepID=A0ABS9FVS3_9PSED|nr:MULTISPECIES: type I secretion system permease/ATPase [Pseudomonas]MBI6979294.1 type I secretion system permease/ATPase [Pseudomonas lactis]MCF4976150.1 type I secretion system permease/ATPase [Pseudomonas lactis]MCF5004649.1 type I secretion system permease/ATPase [Pseudomonas lactis]MCF5010133.1 type I secretion system permease/ATPase [Pseudomonas lactis]MCF5016067.1 type I secretion system permease/ATPase [Pseudomonas lactis]